METFCDLVVCESVINACIIFAVVALGHVVQDSSGENDVVQTLE